MTDKILVILFFFGSHITFNIVGSLSLSELLSLFYLLFLNSKGVLRQREVLSFTHLFILLETTKVISEFFVSNGISSTLKGLAIPLFSVLNTLFLTMLLLRDKDNMGACILTYVVSALFYGNQLAEGVTITDITTGDGATALKFFYAKIITMTILLLSLWRYKEAIAVYGITGFIFVVLGARSAGVIAVLSAFAAYIAMKKQFIYSTKSIVISALVLMSASYPVYVLYVNSVLNGEITAGNSEQLRKAQNPYNPIELLKQGRSDAWVAWQAFCDKPLLGHGAWAYDYSGKYLKMELDIKGVKFEKEKFTKDTNWLVPSHSVLINQGSQNGILAFTCMLLITIYVSKLHIEAIRAAPRKFTLILSSGLFSLWWNVLFSPPSHLRMTLPFLFATALALHIKYYPRPSA